jgi:hypothetical protein
MKKSKNSTVPDSEASPAHCDPLAPQGSLTCQIDMNALRGLTMSELLSLRDAVHTAMNILCGFACQPRFKIDGEKYTANGAGSLLDTMCDWLAGYEQAVINVAEAATPTSAREEAWRNWLLLGFAADLADDLTELAVMATKAVQSVDKVKFREEYNARRGAA